jgi:hypothetical protein
MHDGFNWMIALTNLTTSRYRNGLLIVPLANIKYNLKLASRLVLLFGAALTAQTSYGQLSVTLSPSLPSPQPVGESVNLVATVSNASSALRYRFLVEPPGATTFNMLADYGAPDSVQWSALQQGAYQIQVEVSNVTTGQTGNAVISFQFTSRITGTTPVVSPSSHPLVAIYSAPACAAGTIQVAYRPTSGTNYFYSNILPCQPGLSANFYIGGMRAQTSYTMLSKVVNKGATTWSPALTFVTGSIPLTLPTASIPTPVGPGTSEEVVLLQSFIALKPGQGFKGTAYPPTAYNMYGEVTWYYPTSVANGTYLTRPVPGGTFLIYVWDDTIDVSAVLEVDLQGDVVRETNVYAINLQLTAMNLPTINWMSHEAMRLPNGHTLVLGMGERILTNVQGPGAVDVVGDVIIDLDENLQVAWTWNTFDHLPNSRPPVLGEV